MSQKEHELIEKSSQEDVEPVKVILADDDKEDQELFEQALEKTGVETELTVVNDGQQLVENLKDPKVENPDIIFMDINMPVKDGKQALKEIKKDNELKQIPTVMLSTSGNPKEVQETFDAGASLYITKPHSFKNFILLLKKVFSFHWAGILLRPVWQRFFITEKNIKEDSDRTGI